MLHVRKCIEQRFNQMSNGAEKVIKLVNLHGGASNSTAWTSKRQQKGRQIHKRAAARWQTNCCWINESSWWKQLISQLTGPKNNGSTLWAGMYEEQMTFGARNNFCPKHSGKKSDWLNFGQSWGWLECCSSSRNLLIIVNKFGIGG